VVGRGAAGVLRAAGSERLRRAVAAAGASGGAGEALVAAHRTRGIEPDALTAGARWKREEDIPLEVMLGVGEALAGCRVDG
jgi:hypothetical protein